MSRCYPLRLRTVVLRNGASDGALIKTIKENEKHRTEPRNGNRVEKRRKLLKEVEKKNSNFSGVHRKCHGQKYVQKQKDGYGLSWSLKRCVDDEAEQAEKSDLTEEHGEPYSSQSNSYMSDETQSSSKKRRIASPPSGVTVHRNIIRIKLTSLKPREVDTPKGEEPTCSTSGRVGESTIKHKQIPNQPSQQHCSSEQIDKQKITICNSNKIKDVAQSAGGKTVTLRDAEMQSAEALFKSLFDNLVAPPIPSEPKCSNDDQEWLFGTKQRREPKRPEPSSEVICRDSNASWPQAHYLPAADVYALPFTVPF